MATSTPLIRIKATKEIQEYLLQLRQIHPFLSDSDIFKLAFGNYVQQVVPSNKLNNGKIDVTNMTAQIRKTMKGKFKNQTFSQEEINNLSSY